MEYKENHNIICEYIIHQQGTIFFFFDITSTPKYNHRFVGVRLTFQ